MAKHSTNAIRFAKKSFIVASLCFLSAGQCRVIVGDGLSGMLVKADIQSALHLLIKLRIKRFSTTKNIGCFIHRARSGPGCRRSATPVFEKPAVVQEIFYNTKVIAVLSWVAG
ncbi:hypothetical protein [Desulforhopalus singaporensis]|uniref:hypothetical protein n=1 Tax=Desulforhopalus singaporensis TaxID=91360 RepID=UPI00115F906F|nr:hypothetical protein [Desulforhopalus singaporensis]